VSLKVLIFEDESLSAEHLVKLIRRYDPAIELLGIIESVKQGVDWLGAHPHPDLLLMDIQLSDGSCFELFKQVRLKVPVIFTTAYDEYAIQAFKVNSIDYLLKPIDFQELQLAIEKFGKQRNQVIQNPEQVY
jgi:two-component system, LytTR family, response regulator LytT